MWTEAENNFDQFLDKFIMHELTKDENDNSNNNVSIFQSVLDFLTGTLFFLAKFLSKCE